MPTETEVPVTDKARGATRIDNEILRKARTVAALEGMGIAEVLERDLRPAIDKRYAKATTKAAAELGENGAG